MQSIHSYMSELWPVNWALKWSYRQMNMKEVSIKQTSFARKWWSYAITLKYVNSWHVNRFRSILPHKLSKSLSYSAICFFWQIYVDFGRPSILMNSSESEVPAEVFLTDMLSFKIQWEIYFVGYGTFTSWWCMSSILYLSSIWVCFIMVLVSIFVIMF